MASEGPYFPGATASTGGTGVPWQQPDEIMVQDGVEAFIGAGALTFVDDLATTDYGFAIPGDATIDGIEVQVYGVVFTAGLPDPILYLTKDGQSAAAAGKSITETGAAWVTYGSPTDLWSGTWSAGDFNNIDFGALVGVVYDQFNSWQVEIDAIRVTVHFTEANQQHAYPDADIDAGGWTPSSGTDLYAMLDESPTASDSDYITATAT